MAARFPVRRLASAVVFAQGCALFSTDFGPKHLAPADAGSPSDPLSCVGSLAHSNPQVMDEGLGDLLFAEHVVDLGDAPDGGGLHAAAIGLGVALPRQPCRNTTLDASTDPDAGSNAFGAASYDFAPVFGTASQFVNSTIVGGALALLFRVVGYNGMPDDGEIEVDLVQGRATKPIWDGKDVWSPGEPYTEKIEDSYRARAWASAQVKDSQIDVRLDEVLGAPLVRDVHLLATLTRATHGWKLSGVLTGIVPIDSILKAVPSISFCKGGPSYSPYKDALCSKVDADLTGDGVCDALTVAWKFEAEQAQLGCIRQLDIANPCPAGAPDGCGP